MLGQKRTKDDRLTTQTVQEFFTHFPALQPFVVAEMRQAGCLQQQPSLQLHPSLFPILSIMVKLTAGPKQLSSRCVVINYILYIGHIPSDITDVLCLHCTA